MLLASCLLLGAAVAPVEGRPSRAARALLDYAYVIEAEVVEQREIHFQRRPSSKEVPGALVSLRVLDHVGVHPGVEAVWAFVEPAHIELTAKLAVGTRGVFLLGKSGGFETLVKIATLPRSEYPWTAYGLEPSGFLASQGGHLKIPEAARGPFEGGAASSEEFLTWARAIHGRFTPRLIIRASGYGLGARDWRLDLFGTGYYEVSSRRRKCSDTLDPEDLSSVLTRVRTLLGEADREYYSSRMQHAPTTRIRLHEADRRQELWVFAARPTDHVPGLVRLWPVLPGPWKPDL